MKIAILVDAASAGGRPDEADALVQADCIQGALERSGHRCLRVAVSLELAALVRALSDPRPDGVFNLVESLNSQGRLAHLAPAVLDTLAIPYTGTRTEGLFLTTGKLLTKRWLRAYGLDTPDWLTLEDLARWRELKPAARGCPKTFELPGRAILKPVWEDASVGLDDAAVVRLESPEHARELLELREGKLGGEVFAEAFIEGREFNLSMLAGEGGSGSREALEPLLLPPAEIDFVDYPRDKPRIVGYAAKWEAESMEYHHTPRRFDFPASDAELLTRLKAMAAACWRLFGLGGYVRVDFRVDEGGRPWILEINANPCLSPDAGFAAALERAGIAYDAAIERIVAAAIGY